MDIPRAPRKQKKKYLYGFGAFAVFAFVAVAVMGIGPAVPAVDRSAVFIDVVQRGTMLRQVRGPGTLVPQKIRWVPAVTAGRVERRYVEPGTRVEAGTVLLELSNPDVQLEMLEAERQLSAAQAQLVNLRTTLETARLDQEAVVASTHTQYLEAKRNAEAADELVRRNLMAASQAQTDKERAEELATRVEIERKRLQIQSDAIGEQLEVQRSQVARLENIVQFHRERIVSIICMTSESLTSLSVPLLANTAAFQLDVIGMVSNVLDASIAASRPLASPAVKLSVSSVERVTKSPAVVTGSESTTILLAL